MINRHISPTIIFFCFLITTHIYAQDRSIQGKVTTFENIPLFGVEVKVKSTKQIIKTDSLGRFVVNCNNKDKLSFSGVVGASDLALTVDGPIGERSTFIFSL